MKKEKIENVANVLMIVDFGGMIYFENRPLVVAVTAATLGVSGILILILLKLKNKNQTFYITKGKLFCLPFFLI